MIIWLPAKLVRAPSTVVIILVGATVLPPASSAGPQIESCDAQSGNLKASGGGVIAVASTLRNGSLPGPVWIGDRSPLSASGWFLPRTLPDLSPRGRTLEDASLKPCRC
jgi:hypothetical protein